MKLKPMEEQVFFVSNNLTYKLRPDLINEHGMLWATVIEWIFPKKKTSVVPSISILI